MRLWIACGIVVFTCASHAGFGQQLTARDAFWSASDLVSVTPNPVSKASGAARSASKPPATKPAPRSAAHEGQASAHVSPQQVAANGYGAAPQMVRVSQEQIGLRYSLLLHQQDGTYAEVSPSKVFHSGDQLRISVMANQPGYLYMISQGSSGNWSPVFPGAGSARDANRVESGHLYQFPSGKDSIRFDQHPGDEKLFLIVSRQPLTDLDAMIEQLKSPAATPRPAAPNTGPGAVYEASNHIPDELVQRFASRDLQLVQEQQVDDKAGQANDGEKAVYVVAKAAPAGPGGPQVVAPVTLHHE